MHDVTQDKSIHTLWKRAMRGQMENVTAATGFSEDYIGGHWSHFLCASERLPRSAILYLPLSLPVFTFLPSWRSSVLYDRFPPLPSWQFLPMRSLNLHRTIDILVNGDSQGRRARMIRTEVRFKLAKELRESRAGAAEGPEGERRGWLNEAQSNVWKCSFIGHSNCPVQKKREADRRLSRFSETY